MITYTRTVKPTETKTCSTCPNFNDFHESNGRGWCELFNQQARTFHIKTNDCVLNSPTTEDNLATFSSASLRGLNPFPTKAIELDRDGYPMGRESVENAYDDPNFVTSPDEPF